MHFFIENPSSFIRIKPIFAAKNSVKPIGIYIFLAKDLDNSKKSCNFAADLQNDCIRLIM